MVQLSQYCGKVESFSPESSGFTPQGGRAAMPLYLLESDLGAPPTISDIQSAITQIIGSVSTSVGDGRLQRTMPIAHPVYPWMTASAITSIKGIGSPTRQAAGALLEVATLPYCSSYPNLEFMVEFSSRPYVLAQDSSIPLLKNQTFYDETGTQQTTNIAGEWVRFAWFTQQPKYDAITCRLGQMTFLTGTNSEPNNVPFVGMPRLPLPNSILTIFWSCVPYRFITSSNSYLSRFAGYVNQNTWASWSPGQLLYLGCTAKPYTPPVQQLDSQHTGSTGFIYSSEKWCDVQMNFLLTTRQVTSAPSGAAIANKNFVAAGHNAQPWPGSPTTKGGFFYATVKSNTAANQKPTFPSTEMALLFTDPDATGVYKFSNSGTGS